MKASMLVRPLYVLVEANSLGITSSSGSSPRRATITTASPNSFFTSLKAFTSAFVRLPAWTIRTGLDVRVAQSDAR
jgi:hypothetical protein